MESIVNHNQTTSPSPKFAVTKIFDGSPVIGSRVKRTPADSAATISWMTTAIPVFTGWPFCLEKIKTFLYFYIQSRWVLIQTENA